MKPEIYRITCKANGKNYVGASTYGWKTRTANHRCLLRSGKHNNKGLLEDWIKYGEAQFEFALVGECEFENIIQAERDAYEKFNSLNPKGYNLLMPPAVWGMDKLGRFHGRKKEGNVLYARSVKPEHVSLLDQFLGNLKGLKDDGVRPPVLDKVVVETPIGTVMLARPPLTKSSGKLL